MFCKYCGAQMAEDAAFCPKCGKANATPPVQNAPTNNQPKGASGINLKILIPLAAIIVVLSGVIVAKIVSNNKNSASLTSAGNSASSHAEDISFDDIAKECDGCSDAIAAYLDLMNEALAYGYDGNELDSLISQYSNAMHHDCNAEVTYVENYPYVYRNVLGTYTGEWKGAGPFGEGEFIGKDKFRGYITQYTGEWAYGLPEGNGTLYIQNFADSTWDLTYTGQMRAGLRDGAGNIYEYNHGASYDPMYRIYDTVEFSNDIMTSVTDVATYNAKTKELLYFDRVTGDNSGWVYSLDTWGANDLNPEQRQMLEYAECALVIGTATAMVYGAIKGHQEGIEYGKKLSAESDKYMKEYFAQKEKADLDAYNAQQQKQAQDAINQQRDYCAKQSEIARNNYNNAISSYDPSGSMWQTKVDEYNMNYFARMAN